MDLVSKTVKYQGKGDGNFDRYDRDSKIEKILGEVSVSSDLFDLTCIVEEGWIDFSIKF